MFISVLELFKIEIGPSSSHTLGPMVAANNFIASIKDQNLISSGINESFIRCTLKGSLAYTGKGHSTDNAVALGLHGHLPASLADKDVAELVKQIWESERIWIDKNLHISFKPGDTLFLIKVNPYPSILTVWFLIL